MNTPFRDLEREKTVLKENRESASRKVQAILEPRGDIGSLNLGDIIDRETLQSLMEEFYKLTHILSAVLDHSGNILVAVGWQDICTKFHRSHPDTCKNCLESDTLLSSGVAAGTFKAYRCKNNLWDIATPIEIDGRHMGNIFIGQFFYEDELPDYDLFRSQARKYGFDEKEYLAALDRVPRMSKEKVDAAMTFFTKLAGMIASLSYSNINLSRTLSQQESVLHKLGKSEAKLRQAQTIAQMGDFTWDIATGAITWSDGMLRLLQYDKTENMDYGKVKTQIHHPDDLDRVTRWLMDGIDSGVEYLAPQEYRLIRKDGKAIHVQTNGQIEYQEGKAVKLFGTCLDITERKQAETVLLERDHYISTILNTTQEGFWILDAQGKIIDVNEAYCRMSGYTKNELLQLSIPDLEANERSDETAERIKRITDNGSERFETRHRRKDGSVFDVEISTTWQGSTTQRFICFCHDISKRKKTEAQLQQAQKMESVGRLAGGVAHDFNNMLGVILGHAEMIMEQMDASQPFFSNLQEIQTAAQRSADLTRQLLAFARKQTISPKVLDLNKTVESMLMMLRRLIGENIDLAWVPGKKLWMTPMDPSQIDQILANLCVNARDAISDTGKLTIETGTIVFDESYCAQHQGFKPGEYVLLAVSDNGCGMDTDTQNNIFEPFFTTKGVGKGTGLGLATVYGIVKQNNGFINVYSEPGQGTIFKIYLPRYRGQTDPVGEKKSAAPPVHGNETILLVEDESAILDLTTMMLQRMGYTVLAASTPGEASRLAREHLGKIDLLMTDVVMPEMNGRDLAKNLLSLYPNLKRLFMSGYTANVIAHHGVLDEGVHFIQKPFSKKDLANILEKVLEE